MDNNNSEYWQQQIKMAEDLLNAPQDPDAPPIDIAQVQRDLAGYQAKLDIIQNIQTGAVEANPQIIAITQPALQPYIELKPDGSYSVDVKGMVRDNVDLTHFQALGIKKEDYDKAKAINEISVYKTVSGYNIPKAIQEGNESKLIAAGITKEQIESVNKAQTSKQEYDNALRTLEARYAENGQFTIDTLAKAIRDGNIGLLTIVGFDPMTILEAQIASITPKQMSGEFTPTIPPKTDKGIVKFAKDIGRTVSDIYQGMKGTPVLIPTSGGMESRITGGLTDESITTIGSVLLDTLPIIGTVRHWDEMGTVGKILSIVLDVVCLIPMVGEIGAGAKSVEGLSYGARFAGGAKGAASAIVNQVVAPIEMTMHPIQTVKSTFISLRELAEIANINKIPEAVITTTRGTVRLPVNLATSAEEAKQIRNKLMMLAMAGENPVVEINGVRYELSSSALMKELGGGLAHATPSGEAFTEGLTVLEKKNPLTGEIMSDAEQGLFVANEPLPRFVESSAFGATGEQPAIIITTGDTAKKAIATDKIYAGTAEMELKYPVGTEIPAPIQRLYTRIGSNGLKVVILLDKELTPSQIIKLKSLAIIEDLKAPFNPSLMISGDIKNIDHINDLNKLTDELRISGNEDIARTLAGAFRAKDVISDYLDFTRVTDTAQVRTLDKNGRLITNNIEIRATVLPETPVRIGEIRQLGTRTPYVPYIPENPRIPQIISSVRSETPRIEERPGETRIISERENMEREINLRGGEVRPVRTEVPEVRPPRVEPPELRLTRIEIPPYRPEIRPPEIRPPRTDISPPKIEYPPSQLPKSGIESSEEVRRELFRGSVGWKQGFVYYAIKYPYKTSKDIGVFRKKPDNFKLVPGRDTAYRTIQQLTGRPPSKDLIVRMGLMTVTVGNPGNKVGAKGAIRFKRNPKVNHEHHSGLVTLIN